MFLEVREVFILMARCFRKLNLLLLGMTIGSFCAQNSYAQYENIWMFGFNGGVDFNGVEPVAVTSNFESLVKPRSIWGEASASVCDEKGALLFYTEGTVVINKEHQIMENGDSLISYLAALSGNISSTSSASQGTVIVPIPGKKHKYYVFSLIANEGGYNGDGMKGKLYYSMIDMAANGGLGRVVPGQKGIFLDTGLTELMTAVVGDDYRVWLLTVSRTTEYIKAFEVTGCGVNHNPILSSFPDYLDQSLLPNGVGYIAVSPDRTKIAIAGIQNSIQRDGLAILDFDTLTGRASNVQKLTSSAKYSACFSPDNTKLYAATFFGVIHQFDLSAGGIDAIKASMTQLAQESEEATIGHIKIAPNNKIYFSTNGGLGVIERPNLAGTACNLNPMALRFNNRTKAGLGLPNNIAARRRTALGVGLTKDTGCVPFTAHFSSADSQLIEHYSWDFGDGSAISHQANPQHTYFKAGNYQVFLYAKYMENPCVDTFSTSVVVYAERRLPDISTQDTLLCFATERVDLSVTIHNPSVDTRIQWGTTEGALPGANSSTLSVNPNLMRTYYVRVSDTIPYICGLSVVDTIHIDLRPRILDIVTNDTLICAPDEIALDVIGSAGYMYRWTPMDGVQDPTELSPLLKVDKPITYTITASYPGCPDTAQSIRIDADPLTGIRFSMMPDSICQGESITFYPQIEGAASSLLAQYWQFGEGNIALFSNEVFINHAYEKAGLFPVSVTGRFRACPDSSFVDTVYVEALPYVDLGKDSALCFKSTPLLMKNIRSSRGIYDRLWNTGDTSEILKVWHPGTYSLTLRSKPLGCSSTASVEITKDCYLDIPSAFSPNGDGTNDYFFPRQYVTKSVTQFHMQILNRWGQLIFESHNVEGRAWDGAYNGQPQPGGVYVYRIKVSFPDERQEQYSGNVTLIR